MTGRIFDRLIRRFGRKSVFLDIDSIPFGTDFRTKIDDEMRTSSVLIAIIGTDWTGRRDSGAPSRIEDEHDPIRLEIASALKLGVPIIPVLVNGATMPAAANLPTDVQPLSYLNAIEVDPGRDFHPHVDWLIAAIEQVKPQSHWTRSLRGKAGAISAAVAVAGTVGLVVIAAPRGGALFDRVRLVVAPGAAADYCGTLNGVIASAASGFAGTTAGAPTETPADRPVVLPGYTQCSVQKLADLAYICQATESREKTTADAALKRRADETRPCLGGGWVGPTALGAAWSFARQGTGDTIIFLNNQAIAADNSMTYSPEIMVYRHQEQAAAPAEDAKAPTDFCPYLTKVIASAAKGFDEIKGYDKGHYWLAKLGLRGFSGCTVDPFSDTTSDAGAGRRYYSCQLQPFATPAKAKVAMSGLVETVAACLTDSWSKESDTDGRGRPRWEFHAPGDPLDVEIRLGTTVNSGWNVHLDVNMER